MAEMMNGRIWICTDDGMREITEEKYYEIKKKELEQNLKDGKQCKNCHSYLRDAWEYCIYCGTKKGEGEFNPKYNETILLYGPEYLSFFKCKKCGYKWCVDIIDGGDDEPVVAYCPICGTKKIKMYYKDSNPNVINEGTKDVTLNDILKYKISEFKISVYRIKRKIRSIFNKDEKR